jgi:bifunctional DNA-binding transcriptional regulator/antitoxin component of YhaV-PrlF toxin-antitoxin module
VIPAAIRRRLGIAEGTKMIALVENGAVKFLPRDAVKEQLRAMFADIEGNMADDLIAERRAQARRERGDE